MRAVTLLLTEVVGSIERWEEDEDAMASRTAALDAQVTALASRHGGTLVKPRGEGDSYFLTFDDPVDAVTCAVDLQRQVADEPALPIRTASHIGPAEQRGGDWYGTTVNRCARLRAAAGPRQSLVSADLAAALRTSRRALPEGVSLRSLGRHRLKDLDEPAEVFQVCAPGLVDDHPALATLRMSHGLPLPRSSFVGRAAERAEILQGVERAGVVRVTGPPGVGTTRLALEAAAEWWERSGAAVRLVTDPATADEVSGARREPGELVVVDGARRGLDGAAIAGPAIVTTPHPLALHGESVVRVAPLDEFDAEHLLHERLPDDVVVAPGVVGYCDGLPLAIELLARRASSVDVGVLTQRLAADPLGVLGGDRRADPPRHASVKATLQAAFHLLEPAARADLLAASPGDQRWVEAGWHEPDGPLPLVSAFLAAVRESS